MKEKYSIYVHIPFCKARCGYCAFVSSTDFGLQERYFDKLCDEIEHYSDKTEPIYTLYLGGGTPSSVKTACLDRLFDKLRSCFDLSRVQEVTVECNPESVTSELLDCLKRNSTTRLSFGLQSVNDQTLRAIGRLHDYKQFQNALSLAQRAGFGNVNADLIIGLPETHSDFLRSVQTVAELPIQHISLYALELHPNTSLHSKLGGIAPFSDDEQADMYDEAVEILTSSGFARYEISNFALAGFESKHNLHYWQEGSYYGFGTSAAGFLHGTRYVNVSPIERYLNAPVGEAGKSEVERESVRDQANEFAMLGLRTESGINLSEFSERYGTDFWQFFTNAMELARKGYLLAESGRVRVPADKFYVINSILAELWQDD